MKWCKKAVLKKRAKSLTINFYLVQYLKIIVKFVVLYSALELKYKLGSNEFYLQLTKFIPNLTKCVALIVGVTKDYVINSLGIRELLNRY